MILNLASDIPFIYKDNDFIFFERKELESNLPKFFKESWNLDEIYVIVWPWNFSSTRIWVEVINILIFLWYFNKVYFLDKLDLFTQLWYENIYLFSGNKNKPIFLKEDKNYDIIKIFDLENFKFEETFYLDYWKEKILYKDLFKNIKGITWNKLDKWELLVPYYIFQPIVG